MLIFKRNNTEDITEYILSSTWSGDKTQAARKIDFSIAYNLKDKNFKNLNIVLGDLITVYYVDEKANKIADTAYQALEIFRGRIFFRQRTTNENTMTFIAYDNLIYMAKSKLRKKFSNMTIDDVIKQVCNELGVLVGEITPIGVNVDFIADAMTGTEIIKKAFDLAYAANQKHYHCYMKEDKLYVVEENEIVENYVASDYVNVQYSSHSESIEEMINVVKIVDEAGNEVGYVQNEADKTTYGMLQDIYKIDKKQDTQSAAKALLKTVKYESSISVLGNIQCITGYAITVQEEQLKGKFAIIQDTHKFENNTHIMDLNLKFLEEVNDSGK